LEREEMPESRPHLTRVLETVLYYSDAAQTERFYVDILGMRLLDSEPGRSLFFRAGESVFLLFKADETLQGKTLPAHGASGPIHTCFQVPEEEYEPWKAYLASRGVPVIHEMSWPRGLSFYFHDPDGNVLEIANADIWPR
jgi:catechol 2,3-dioxygenase-like lactoylglutathione lyase family enzyme